jgi:hypothetical protein
MTAGQLQILERHAEKHPPRKRLSLVDGLGIEPREPLGIVTPLETHTVDRLAEALGSPRGADQLHDAALILTRYRYRILHGFHRSVFRQETGEVRNLCAVGDISCAQQPISAR